MEERSVRLPESFVADPKMYKTFFYQYFLVNSEKYAVFRVSKVDSFLNTYAMLKVGRLQRIEEQF